MITTSVKTRILVPPKDDLFSALSDSIKKIAEGSILAVTSKIVSISQGRCVPISDYPDKDVLIKKEADLYLPREFTPNGWVIHTIKNGLFIPTAGIDLSNADSHYILWPEDPMSAAREIRSFFKKKFNLNNFGVIITDSHSVPLHRGVVGITLGFAGFSPIKDYRGKKDLFGKEFIVEMSNIADMLSSAAVLTMGEGGEQTPAAIISDVPFVDFVEKYEAPNQPYSSFNVPIDEDLFGPFIKSAPWEKK